MSPLKNLDLDELKELLLVTTGQRTDERFFLEPRLHPAIELQRAHDRAGAADKARLKRALVEAVAEWRPRAHGVDNLRFLSKAAAALRARATAPHFERLLRRQGWLANAPLTTNLEATGSPASHVSKQVHISKQGHVSRKGRVSKQGHISGHLASTLAGFAPGERIGALLERLFFTPGLKPELAGVLLQGLCNSRRESLPRYLERYLRLIEGSDVNHFANTIFLRQFIDGLTPVALAEIWSDLAPAPRSFLLESFSALVAAENPDLFFAIELGGATLHVEVNGRHEAFELRSESVDDRFHDLHKAYGLIHLPPL